LADTVELGALWAAIPRTHRLPAGAWLPSWRPTIEIVADSTPSKDGGDIHVLLMSLSGNPHLTGDEVLADALLRYPTLPPDTRAAIRQSEKPLPGGWIADAVWHPGQATLDTVAPIVEMGDSRCLIPLLPNQTEQLSPLMLWWTMLFGLSVLARYEPGLWGEALDVSRDQHAVPLEALLEHALIVMPGLVYESLLALDSTT
jgi:hypothetical protein